MPLTTNVRVEVNAQETAPRDLGTAVMPHSLKAALSLANGALAGQANVIYSDTGTIAASGTATLDLAGTLVGALGDTLTFARVKAIIVTAASANTNNVVVGGAASNGFSSIFADATDRVVVRPGGAFVLFTGAADLNGYAVTAGTGDQLQIANSGAGTTVTYSIVVVGTS